MLQLAGKIIIMQDHDSEKAIKLNLGCGERPLPDYINIDLNTLEELKVRYPATEFPEGIEVFQYDILNLPYEDSTVDLIKADSLIEHLSFSEEPKFFYEVIRVLKLGGIFEFSTPDFDETVRLWTEAKDEWKEFYRCDEEAIKQQHWFGQYSYAMNNKWGYLTASIFGPQNSAGQFHKNCYTVPKLKVILKQLSFKEIEILHFRWKGDRNLMIKVIAQKL